MEGNIAGRLDTESLANVLEIHLLRTYSGTVVPKLEDVPLDALKLNQVKDFIEERLAEDLTIADMAAVVHLSQFHFARAFKVCHRYFTPSLPHLPTPGKGSEADVEECLEAFASIILCTKIAKPTLITIPLRIR